MASAVNVGISQLAGYAGGNVGLSGALASGISTGAAGFIGQAATAAGMYEGFNFASEHTDSINQKIRLSEDSQRNLKQISSNVSSGNDLNIKSQDDILISASNLNANNNLNLTSQNGLINIASALEEETTNSRNERQDFDDVAFEYNRGRASLDLNSEIFEQIDSITKLTHKSSNLNANNNINISAKDDINILASNVVTNNEVDVADKGQINLISSDGNVNILSQKNTINSSTQIKQENLSLSFGVGNAHVDTAYAVHDLKEATDALAEAKANLNRLETKYKNGEASKDAVEDAKINLALATANFALAEIKMAASATKSAGSCKESKCTGFYGDVRLNAATTKINSNSQTISNLASNIISNIGDITIKSGLGLSDTDEDLLNQLSGNTNITGSNVRAVNDGDINITSKANTNIKASKDTFASNTKTTSQNSSITLASTNSGGNGATIDNIVNAAAISLGAGIK